MAFRKHLPPAAAGALSTAAAMQHGITRAQLRNTELAAPFRGVRLAASGFDAEDPVQLARAYLPKLPPGSVFSHHTAASIWGLPLPDGTRPPSLHVTTPPSGRARRGEGVIGHRSVMFETEMAVRFGLPVTTPPRTWCDLGNLIDVPGLVAVGDRLLWFLDPLCTRRELEDAVDATRAGVRSLRAALPLLSDRSQSHRESMLRVLIVLSEYPFPSPSPNHELTLRPGGRRVRLDLAFPTQQLALEYEGDHHRTNRTHIRPVWSSRSAPDSHTGEPARTGHVAR